MARVLVAHTTLSGSTVEVAQAIGAEIAAQGWSVDCRPIQDVRDLAAYAGVVVGAPMILGWHRAALAFVRRHRADFQRVPLAVCVMGMSLTQTSDMTVAGVPVFVDPQLPKPPAVVGTLTFRERYATLLNYLHPILAATRPAKPVALGVFGGRLEYGRLPWWAVLFGMVILQAPAGDRRNWAALRAWAAGLPAEFAARPRPA